MSVAKVVEISSRSETSFEDAIEKGVVKAGESVRNMREAWVNQMTVQIDGTTVVGYQVDMKITFVVD